MSTLPDTTQPLPDTTPQFNVDNIKGKNITVVYINGNSNNILTAVDQKEEETNTDLKIEESHSQETARSESHNVVTACIMIGALCVNTTYSLFSKPLEWGYSYFTNASTSIGLIGGTKIAWDLVGDDLSSSKPEEIFMKMATSLVIGVAVGAVTTGLGMAAECAYHKIKAPVKNTFESLVYNSSDSIELSVVGDDAVVAEGVDFIIE